jgi:hypothetical protein
MSEQDELSCIVQLSLKCFVTFCPCCHTFWFLLFLLISSPVDKSVLKYASRNFGWFADVMKVLQQTNQQTEQPLHSLTISAAVRCVLVFYSCVVMMSQ